jgi:hypothetical protein
MPERININSKVETVIDNSSNTNFHIMCIYDGVVSNNKPVVNSPLFVDLTENESYQFDPDLILNAYTDAENDQLWRVKILDIPPAGELTIGDVRVLNNVVIPWSLFGELKWKPPLNQYGLGYSRIVIAVKDDGAPLRCYSDPIEIIFNILPINQEPTVADSEITTNWKSTITLTPNLFTSNYYDPEGDNLGYIVIHSGPPTIKGRLIFQGIPLDPDAYPITITAAQLINGDLQYEDTGALITEKSIEIDFSVFDDNN